MIFIIIIMIFAITSIYISYFTNKFGKIMIAAAEVELKAITTNIVSGQITAERLRKVTIEDLIIVNKNKQEEITDVSFRLDVAYDMLIEMKEALDKEVLKIKENNIPETATVINNNLIIKVPFYAYTNNPLLMNLGPKVYIKINMVETVRGSITTKISSYGINTALIDLYLNLFITESILFPTTRESIVLTYEILLSSKVIQGKVPSLYTKGYENESPLINIE